MAAWTAIRAISDALQAVLEAARVGAHQKPEDQ